MAELTPKERLQPSLLDRLTDEEPRLKEEPRDKRVLSPRKLRDCVVRDLAWLFNAGQFASLQPLDEYPFAAQSVLNYGLPDLAGKTVSGLDASALERALRQAIWDFEPRILSESVKVHVVLEEQQRSHNTLTFEIEGDLWAQPLPLKLYLETQMDLENGTVQVIDSSQGGGPR